jgi:hypothetical protein
MALPSGGPRRSKVLPGVAGAKDRAKRFGKSHTKPQPVLPVTVTLRDVQAPDVVFPGSAHPTTVLAPDGKSVLAELKSGEKASFHADVDSDGKVGSWSRVGAPVVATKPPVVVPAAPVPSPAPAGPTIAKTSPAAS